MLFSPSQAAYSSSARTATTGRTPRTGTLGLSRASDFGDFGSLDTAARSSLQSDAVLDDDEEEEEDEDEDGELDSLDSLDDGLQAFRENDATILPTHNGLGSFLDSSGAGHHGSALQDQIWEYERYNPKRKITGIEGSRSSIQRRLDSVDEFDTLAQDEVKRQRIEDWRMEQSRALLVEIERETRRLRRRSRTGSNASRSSLAREAMEAVPEMAAVLAADERNILAGQPEEIEDEGFWRRVTRRVIRDLIGIDDKLLSVIFGEELMEEEEDGGEKDSDERSTTPKPEESFSTTATKLDVDTTPWSDRLLERIARELGILVHQICEHPGAFSTYLRSSGEFTGLISTAPNTATTVPRTTSRMRNQRPETQYPDSSMNPVSSTYTPTFHPTIPENTYDNPITASTATTASHAASWGIDENDIDTGTGAATPVANSAQNSTTAAEDLRRAHEHWERDLDIGMIFSFLRNRFARRTRHSHSHSHSHHTNTHSHSHSHSHTTQANDPSRRASLIRQHHPLINTHTSISHRQSQRRRTGTLGISSPAALSSLTGPLSAKRAASSCASQSGRGAGGLGMGLAGRSLSVSISGSSRNFWDIGGSAGGSAAASVVGSAAGVGAWGEV